MKNLINTVKNYEKVLEEKRKTPEILEAEPLEKEAQMLIDKAAQLRGSLVSEEVKVLMEIKHDVNDMLKSIYSGALPITIVESLYLLDDYIGEKIEEFSKVDF